MPQVLPVVGASKDVWGTALNVELVRLDAAITTEAATRAANDIAGGYYRRFLSTSGIL